VPDPQCVNALLHWGSGTFFEALATPEEQEEITIPASKWAVFEVHGPMPDAMQNAWEQIFSEWFPSSAYEHAGTAEL
jgi:AraC family transcriptional regulator